jgi:hypothetical protein
MSGIRNMNSQSVIFEELCRLSGYPSFNGAAKFEVNLSDTAWQQKSPVRLVPRAEKGMNDPIESI